MPLRDHFRPPVNDKHHWSSLHGQWPGEIVRTLFDALPPAFRASPNVHLGAAFEADGGPYVVDACDPGTGDGTTPADTAPTLTVEADLSEQDEYEVRLYDEGRTLVAAVEIVSPSNKDRPERRSQFVGKVAALLREGASVSVVDVVTDHQSNLYAELLARLGRAAPRLGDPPPALYAVTLRVRKPPKLRTLLDAWFFPLGVGLPLPRIPLWLSPDLRIELPLEPSYQEACRLLRIA